MQKSQPAQAIQGEAQTQASSGSIASLVARGGSWKCSVTHTSDKDSTSGTVYVSGSKVRGDFESTVASAGAVQSHMISDGVDVYVWSNQMPSGMKMKAVASSDGGTQTTGGQSDYYNQNYDYNCEPWTVDQSQFTLPSDITFNDMSAMLQGMQGAAGAEAGAGTMPTGMNCAMCDQAPTAEAKAACKSAMRCN